MSAFYYKFTEKKIRYLAKYLFIFISNILLLNISLLGQTKHANISVVTGSFPIFKFNTLTQLNDGIPLLNHTTIKINFIDELTPGNLDPASTWRLRVRAADATITGSLGNTMSVDKIDLQIVSYIGGTGTINLAATGTNWLNLSLGNNYYDLITNGENSLTDKQVVISYYVGQTNPIAGESADFYVIYLDFMIDKFPP